jgi:hypothetical protein
MNSNKSNYSKDFLERSHKGCFCNKEEILQGELCGCFFCCEISLPTEITEWIIEKDNLGETAVCPKCTMDSVLSSKYPISDENFLKQMHEYHF